MGNSTCGKLVQELVDAIYELRKDRRSVAVIIVLIAVAILVSTLNGVDENKIKTVAEGTLC